MRCRARRIDEIEPDAFREFEVEGRRPGVHSDIEAWFVGTVGKFDG